VPSSLLDIRRDLGERYTHMKVIVTGVRYGSAYTGTASGTHARRRIVSSDLVAMNKAGTSGELDTTDKNYSWTYVPLTAEQGRIVQNGYVSYATASSVLTGNATGSDSEAVGYLTIDTPLETALPGETEVEVHGRFPVLGGENLPGLHWAINQALQVMHWPHAIGLSGVTGSQRYDLYDQAGLDLWWLTRPEQMVRVFRPETNSAIGPAPMQGRAWLEPDGGHLWLYVPERVATGETFSVQVRRPCHTLIRSGGAEWLDSRIGLVDDADECLPDTNRVSAVAWAMIAQRMALRGPAPERDGWAKVAAEQMEAVKPFLAFQTEAPTPTRQRQARVPVHTTGKAWRPLTGFRRGWP
jgi:hypothetical protein